MTIAAAQGITFAIEHITPSIAEDYLRLSVGNRKVSQHAVSRYAAAIRKGEWLMNGEAVKLDEEGNLLDGQHRLHAVVHAGNAIDTCVIRGLPRSAFGTLDGGRARSQADLLYVLDYKHPHALARAGRMLFAYERKNWTITGIGKSRASNDELLTTIKKHPGILAAVDGYMRKPLFTTLLPHSVGILVFYLGSCVSKRKAKRFFTDLASGKFDSSSKTHQVRVLRERLEQTNAEILKPSSVTKLVWTITAWNHFVNGQPLPRLSRIIDGLPRLKPDPVKLT